MGVCVWVCMDACLLSHAGVWWLLHAFPASVCVIACVPEREMGRGVQIVTDTKEFVNFALESGQKPLSFFYISFVSRIYE